MPQPKYIGLLFAGGFGLLTAFAPGLLPFRWQLAFFCFGAAAVIVALGGMIFHYGSEWRSSIAAVLCLRKSSSSHKIAGKRRGGMLPRATAAVSRSASQRVASENDRSRMDEALYAMFQLLADAQLKGYQEARNVPGEVSNAALPSAPHGVSLGKERLAKADEALVLAIQKLSDIQYREFVYYKEELQRVFGNGPISAARQAIAKMQTLLYAIPEKPDAALVRALDVQFREFDEAMFLFGQWIVDRMEAIKVMRTTCSS